MRGHSNLRFLPRLTIGVEVEAEDERHHFGHFTTVTLYCLSFPLIIVTGLVLGISQL